MSTPAQGQLQKTRKRCPFSIEEDIKLSNLVRIYGDKNWNIIASCMFNRSSRQCRERWVNALNGNINKSSWLPEDDARLIQVFNQIGPHWKEMEKFFPGRVSYDLRNHYKSLIHRMTDKFNIEKNNKIDVATEAHLEEADQINEKKNPIDEN